MTRRKRLRDRQRPRRVLGDLLRHHVHCPFCIHGALRIVRFREATVRFECRLCGQRFTLDLPSTVEALRRGGNVEEAEMVELGRRIYPGSGHAPSRSRVPHAHDADA